MKDICIIAKFGKGRKSHLKEYRFNTREAAVRFGKMFLRYNPFCRTYTVYGD